MLKNIFKRNKKSEQVITPNVFMKILIHCISNSEYSDDLKMLLKDWNWDIVELERHKYHCIGVHPTAKRIDIIKENVIIH